jgi:hypothetical protein
MLHWAAKQGLPRTCQALMTFPDAGEAISKLNHHLLTPSDLAQRYGHLEVACLLRYQNISKKFIGQVGQKM